MEKNKITVIIAAHKKYWMPEDPMYLPLHVGAEGKTDEKGNPLDLGYCKDNSGENISTLNPSFCELTGLYWAWKNLDSEYIGLSHYRRHFSIKKKKTLQDSVLTQNEIQPYLGTIKLFVPKKRKYYIESLYSHYAHTHYSSQLDYTREIISKDYPEYLKSYDKIVKHTYGYMFNMLIARKELLNDYCEWLFDILFKLQDMPNKPELSAYQERYFGRVSEIIFNVWLDYQIESGRIGKKELMEIPCIHMEKINWWKKGKAFLNAKLFHKKYEGSF